MNHQAIMLPIEFGLDWWKDSDIRKEMLHYYFTQEMTWPDEELMVIKLQNKANLIAEKYNKLFSLIGLSEEFSNPLENYDRFEDWTDDGKSSSDQMYSEFPMDKGIKKNVNQTETGINSGNVHHGHIHGNIGVMTLGESEKQTEQMYERLYMLKQRYIKEFDNLFMITM